MLIFFTIRTKKELKPLRKFGCPEMLPSSKDSGKKGSPELADCVYSSFSFFFLTLPSNTIKNKGKVISEHLVCNVCLMATQYIL